MTDKKEEIKQTVYTKMALVMAEVESVKKSAHNDYQNYDYANEADILAAIRGSLVKHKLLILPAIREDIVTDGVTTLRMDFRIIDAETGETITVPWMGTGHDKLDKGAYKAMTGALKYFLLKSFLIATNDDPEKDNGTVKEEARAHEPENEEGERSSDLTERITPRCATCGKPAVRRDGVSKTTGKEYHALFCSSKDGSHTEWL